VKKVHFIDCGSNIGNAIDWAIEKYKERLIKIDAFEPEYLNYSHILKKFSKNDSLDLTVYAQAVWVKNEIKDFWIQAWGTRTGSSLCPNKEQTIKKGQFVPYFYKGKPVGLAFSGAEHTLVERSAQGVVVLQDFTAGSFRDPVQCLNLSDWIFKNLNKENHNVLKIDIEGAEYKVIDHLLKTGAYKYIDEWLVEFTPKIKAPENFSQEVIDRFKSTVSDYTDWGPMGEVIMEKNSNE